MQLYEIKTFSPMKLAEIKKNDDEIKNTLRNLKMIFSFDQNEK